MLNFCVSVELQNPMQATNFDIYKKKKEQTNNNSKLY